MNYLSVCSGIEAATVAWHPLGWSAVGYAEIDPFASAVLADRYGSNLPGEPLSGNAPPNFGDFTAIDLASLGPVDLFVGGTPCQAFSFAGARQSLRDARGNLTLAYAVLAHELARSHGLRNALWENVPGVLSTDDNAFGCFLGALVGVDAPVLPASKPAGKRGNDYWTYSRDIDDIRPAWPDEGMVEGPRARAAWRILDAQYFGLAQRRARVFVVVDFGIGADPAAVLFERQGLRGNSAPCREAGQDVAATVTASVGGCSGKDAIAGRVIAFGGNNQSGAIDVATTLTRKSERLDFASDTFLAYVPDVAATLTRGAESQGKGGCAGRRQEDDVNLVACEPYVITERGRAGGRNLEYRQDGIANAILTPSGGRAGMGVGAIIHGHAVRRLTPVECARLQGFEDHHSRIAWRGRLAEACPDGPQYKTFGNSMPVKVMRWLGERLAAEMPR